MKVLFWIFVFFVPYSFSESASVSEEPELIDVFLTDHEPNLIGYTYDDDDDEPFLDFKLSLEYPIAKGPLERWTQSESFPSFLKGNCSTGLITGCQPYFAFTGRFGQYLGVRESSPVVSKRFNPKIFFRFQSESDSYLDLEYAHESNGQRITSLESYLRVADDFENNGDKREHANDYISRGWDYVGWTWKYRKEIDVTENFRELNFYISYANYIGGRLQGDIEEYFEWEPERTITSRSEVNGWHFVAKIKGNLFKEWYAFQGYKFAIIHDTGTKSPFTYNTFKVELTTTFLTMPVTFWVRNGYNTDLAQYYKKVTSVGVAFEFKTFE